MSARLLVLLLTPALAVVAAGAWAWQSGRLAELSARLAAALPVPADVAGTRPPVPETVTDDAGRRSAPAIRTWVDAQGTRHFAAGAAAPQEARRHVAGEAGSDADYEQALADERGITRADLEQARRMPATADAGTAQTQSGLTQTHQQVAVGQARELLHNYQQALEKIRAQNASP